ncbi:zinc finger BED domain-containing protein RICESLEEPER 2-like protein [Tanacetum coccineum]
MRKLSVGLDSHSFHQAKCKKSLARMCIIDNRPFTVLEGKLVYCSLQERGTDVFSITVDDALSNDEEIKFLVTMRKRPNAILDFKYLHVRYCVTIINLVVKDGFDENFESITKIRFAVKHIQSSPSRFESFKESVEKENIECKRKACLDVETRWNSTFIMLETTEKYSAAFDSEEVCGEGVRNTEVEIYFPDGSKKKNVFEEIKICLRNWNVKEWNVRNWNS